MINRVVLVGRLTHDPVLRKTQAGTSVTSFTLACNRRKTKDGQQEADFINCVAWNKTADIAQQYLSKGSLIAIDGRIQTRSYDGKDGKRVYITEVIVQNLQFIDYKKQDQLGADTQGACDQGGYDQDYGFNSADMLDIASDDLPF